MVFHIANIMDVTDELKDYDVIFLAALGVNIDDKNKVIHHLAKYITPGAILMLRCVHGARAFLYPVVDPNVLDGFNVLSIFHPDDDVINSVVISRKFVKPVNIGNNYHDLDIGSLMASSCKYCDIQPFNHPLGHMKMVDGTRLTPTSLKMCMCLKDHLDAQECKQHQSGLENPIDFEEKILDAEVQQNEAISLSEEEITQDVASSEGTMSGLGSGGEEIDVDSYRIAAYEEDDIDVHFQSSSKLYEARFFVVKKESTTEYRRKIVAEMGS
uniref:Nicotianamine synthase n=1 Tax=Tanacetum cinerariifolium TaxID=118510 RepID=A0A699IYQ0_TANCI|nr:nicotianamine synthase, S-adenosyl-L-methionine-dependent methyltransferase [Tanacetum cinerariifolium]